MNVNCKEIHSTPPLHDPPLPTPAWPTPPHPALPIPPHPRNVFGNIPGFHGALHYVSFSPQVIISWVWVIRKRLNVNCIKIHSIILSVTCHSLRNFLPLIHMTCIHLWIFETLQVIISWVWVICKRLNMNWKKDSFNPIPAWPIPTQHDPPHPTLAWPTPPHPCMTHPTPVWLTPSLHDPPHPYMTYPIPPYMTHPTPAWPTSPHPCMTHPTPPLYDPPTPWPTQSLHDPPHPCMTHPTPIWPTPPHPRYIFGHKEALFHGLLTMSPFRK